MVASTLPEANIGPSALLSTLRSFTESGSSPFALAMTGHSAFELEKVAVASERPARSLIVLIGLQAFNETIQQRSRQAYLGREWCARAVELSGRRLTPLLTSPSRGCRACASRPEPVCASSSIRDAADGSARHRRFSSWCGAIFPSSIRLAHVSPEHYG
jgi:hypothetical protein